LSDITFPSKIERDLTIGNIDRRPERVRNLYEATYSTIEASKAMIMGKLK